MAPKNPTEKQDLSSLVQIMQECPFPILRVDEKGKPLFMNRAVLQHEGLLVGKTGKLNRALSRAVVEAFKENSSNRFDVQAGKIILDVYINPVVENGYVNIYGRDVTRMREKDKKLADAAKFPSENPNPVIRIDRNYNVLLANDSAYDIPGIVDQGPPETLVGDLVRVAEQAIATNKMQQYQLDSGSKSFLFNVATIKGEDYLNIYGREITAERDAKAALESVNSELEKRVVDRTASVRLLQNIVLAANGAESFEAALQTALHEICTFADWPVGHAYVIWDVEGKKTPVPMGIWHTEQGFNLSSLREMTESRKSVV